MLHYCGANFIRFGFIFVRRLLSGEMFFSPLPDELQIFSLWCLGISASFVGSMLFLRRMEMLVNSLSHTVLLGIILSLIACGKLTHGFNPLEGSIPTDVVFVGAFFSAVFTSLATEYLRRVIGISKDASIAIVFSFLFALGLVLVTAVARRTHVGLDLIMGNLELVSYSDVRLAFFTMLVNVFVTYALRRPYTAVAFDEQFAGATLWVCSYCGYILVLQTSAIIMVSIKSTGIFLPLAYMVGVPMMCARFAKSVTHLWKISVPVSCLISFVSIAFSRHALSVFGVAVSPASASICFMLLFHLILIFAFQDE